MTSESDNPFWDYSLAVYDRPGVADACLALQDRHGLDVNILLLCCWTGSQDRSLSTTDVARLMASVEDWQRSVVRPLREVRRRLKGWAGPEGRQIGTLRNRVKDCELSAERVEQIMLHDALPQPAPVSSTSGHQAARAAANLAAYLDVAGVAITAADRRDLEALLGGAFGAPPDAGAPWFPD